MDNYNQDEPNEETGVETKETGVTENKHVKRFKLPAFFSGIMGGVISSLIVILLFMNNFAPTSNMNTNENPNLASNNDVTPISNMITTDDHSSTGIDKASKAVVGIVNIQQRNVWTPNEEVGSGSGIIYKKEDGKAYIVTNNHVVDGAEVVEIDINNEQRLQAKVLGTDELTDLAVLEVDGSTIEDVADLGSSDQLLVGDTVLAIGNPLGMDFSGSVTKGIISGLDRSIKVDTTGDNQADWIAQVIQTDAAINPGNSGGALVNAQGEVIGINSMKVARQEVEGIGFAIPIDAAIPIIEQLEKNGEIARPFIGVSTVEMNQVPREFQNNVIVPEDVNNGMVVANVQKDSPADQAGLQQFDVITKINGQEITSALDLRSYLYAETGIGDTIKIEIYRDGKPQQIDLTLTNQRI